MQFPNTDIALCLLLVFPSVLFVARNWNYEKICRAPEKIWHSNVGIVAEANKEKRREEKRKQIGYRL